jgi:hypothetical protein
LHFSGVALFWFLFFAYNFIPFHRHRISIVIPALRQAQDRPGLARAGIQFFAVARGITRVSVIPALRQAQDRPGFARAGIQFLLTFTSSSRHPSESWDPS